MVTRAEIDAAKLARLPEWAQREIRGLQREVVRLGEDLDEARARVEELSEGVTDTMLVSDDREGVLPDRPLGDGATIDFGDIYRVRFGTGSSGDVAEGLRHRKMLFVSATHPVAVLPTFNPEEVAITLAEVGE
jgi:hypothetical protein